MTSVCRCTTLWTWCVTWLWITPPRTWCTSQMWTSYPPWARMTLSRTTALAWTGSLRYWYMQIVTTPSPPGGGLFSCSSETHAGLLFGHALKAWRPICVNHTAVVVVVVFANIFVVEHRPPPLSCSWTCATNANANSVKKALSGKRRVLILAHLAHPSGHPCYISFCFIRSQHHFELHLAKITPIFASFHLWWGDSIHPFQKGCWWGEPN